MSIVGAMMTGGNTNIGGQPRCIGGYNIAFATAYTRAFVVSIPRFWILPPFFPRAMGFLKNLSIPWNCDKMDGGAAGPPRYSPLAPTG